ncbi:MAG: hypothetical protein R2883_00270 [Caldisericia bacterium]
MTYGPEPLTAGMTPELQNPESPLYFTFTDDSGEPVDFSRVLRMLGATQP